MYVVFAGLLTSVCGLCWTSDFCAWSLLETKACFVAHMNVEVLKLSLVREWAKITQEHYRAAVDELQRRIDMVIDVKGGHIEI